MTQRTKPKIAFFDFAGCEGCQLTILDALQTEIELLDVVDIVQFREAMTEKHTDYQIAFVEGSCTRPSDEGRLNDIREQARIVVALGACAHIGGVNMIRNLQPLDQVRDYVYGSKAGHYETYPARPINDIIPIDAVIPGCPIDRAEFTRAVKALLQGRRPEIPDYPVCVECKLLENQCVYFRGKTCLGPITRAGCGALCPSFLSGCNGCRGWIPNPNVECLKQVMIENGLDENQVQAKMGLFMSNHIVESEVASHEG
jgi:sulfhydrogenase subunit delta